MTKARKPNYQTTKKKILDVINAAFKKNFNNHQIFLNMIESSIKIPTGKAVQRVSRLFKLKWEAHQEQLKFLDIRRSRRLKYDKMNLGPHEAIASHERRLDVLLWRSGLVDTIRDARHLIGASSVTVNGTSHRITSGSQLEVGDIAQLASKKRMMPVLQQIRNKEEKKNKIAQESPKILFGINSVHQCLRRFQKISEEDLIFRMPPFHIDVHYPSHSFILSDIPKPQDLEYPFRFL